MKSVVGGWMALGLEGVMIIIEYHYVYCVYSGLA